MDKMTLDHPICTCGDCRLAHNTASQFIIDMFDKHDHCLNMIVAIGHAVIIQAGSIATSTLIESDMPEPVALASAQEHSRRLHTLMALTFMGNELDMWTATLEACNRSVERVEADEKARAADKPIEGTDGWKK